MSHPLAHAATWEVGTSTSLIEPEQQQVDACRRAGFDCMEIVFQGKYDDPVQQATPLLQWTREAGLRLHSVHLPYGWPWDVSHPDKGVREKALAGHKRLLDEAAPWGPAVAVIHPSYEPIPADDRQSRLQYGRDGLNELSEYAHGLGIQLCVECLPRTCLGNTSEEILYLAEGSPRLGVCCDVNHLFHETPADFIRRVGSRIATVHMSDNDGVDECHWLPGRGVIDWPAVIAALIDVRYEGPFLFEARGRGDTTVTPADVMAWWRATVGA